MGPRYVPRTPFRSPEDLPAKMGRQLILWMPLLLDELRPRFIVEICCKVPVPGDSIFDWSPNTRSIIERRQQIPLVLLGLLFLQLRFSAHSIGRVRIIAH